MLLPWNKPARLSVETDSVKGYVGPAEAATADIGIAADAGLEPAASYGQLEAAIVAAIATTTAAGDSASERGRRIRYFDIELADALLHFDVVNIDARSMPPSELRRLVSLSIADTLGLAADELAVRCSVQGGGQSVVACAAPVALLDAIKRAVSAAGFATRRIEPAFGIFWNRHYASVQMDEALFVRVRHASVLCGWLVEGKWRALAAERAPGFDWTQLRDLCDAFCSRMCVPNRENVPILYDAELEAIPEEMRDRWQAMPAARLAA